MNNVNLTKYVCKSLGDLLIYVAGVERKYVLKGLLKTQHEAIKFRIEEDMDVKEMIVQFLIDGYIGDVYTIRISLTEVEYRCWIAAVRGWLGKLVVVPPADGDVDDVRFLHEVECFVRDSLDVFSVSSDGYVQFGKGTLSNTIVLECVIPED